MSEQTSDVAVLEITRTIHASRERVFAAWTQAEQIAQWFGPETCSVRDAEIDLRVGGAYRFKMSDGKHGEVEVAGVYKEIVEPEKLVFSWEWQTEPLRASGVSEVTVVFVEKDESTEIQLRHVGLTSDELAADHQRGWSGCFDCLEKLIVA